MRHISTEKTSFLPIPPRPGRLRETVAARERHPARTGGAMHHQQPPLPVTPCGNAHMVILRVKHQVPRLHFLPRDVRALAVLGRCTAALAGDIAAPAEVRSKWWAAFSAVPYERKLPSAPHPPPPAASALWRTPPASVPASLGHNAAAISAPPPGAWRFAAAFSAAPWRHGS